MSEFPGCTPAVIARICSLTRWTGTPALTAAWVTAE